MKELRPTIIRAHQNGNGVREISRFLDVPLTTVHDAIKRFKETGSNQDKPKGRPAKTARSQKNIQRAKAMIRRNRTTKANSSRKLAKKLGVSQRSARRILREDLNLKPYKLIKRQKLTPTHCLKRRQRCPVLLRRFSEVAIDK